MENLLDGCRVLLVLISAHFASAGQCCNSYYDITFDYHDAKWCSSYCCGASTSGVFLSTSVGVLECCDNFLLAASSEDTSSICADFFLQNIWVPILIALGGLGSLICICVVVACCCQGGNHRGGVVQPAQPQTSLIMVAGSSNPQYPQGPYGAQQYPQGTYPPGNQAPGYPPGAAYPPGAVYPPPVYGAGTQSALPPKQSADHPSGADQS
ncbi:protein shisa-4-like [Mya arenaria]|uniref:protein shisa-4-like n=1 Tax=Mya arenaria TaxID=6604 RepID=UPI0022E1A759|nr:protein shisa-4-like [Mya arenaria]